MHWYVGIGTVTFLAADLIYTTEPDQRLRAEDVWVTMLLYCEIQLLIWWVIPYYKLDQGADLLYMWEFIKKSQT